MSKPRRKNVPPSSGRYIEIENDLIQKIEEVATSLSVPKTQVINDSIRNGLGQTINQIKYGK